MATGIKRHGKKRCRLLLSRAQKLVHFTFWRVWIKLKCICNQLICLLTARRNNNGYLKTLFKCLNRSVGRFANLLGICNTRTAEFLYYNTHTQISIFLAAKSIDKPKYYKKS